MDGTVSGTAGGFSAMTQDALTVLNDIPFSIPPYFALLARAIVTLEGVALTGDPSYGIILESYPFVARKLLSEDRPEIQRALQQVLYAKGGDGLQTTRLSVLLNSALGVVARQSGGAFVDFDSIPEGAVDLTTSVKFLLSQKAVSLREVLVEEAVNAADILLRQAARKAFSQITTRLPVPPFFGRFLPRPENIRAPFLIPSPGGGAPFSTVFMTPVEMLDIAAPKLTRDEEFFAISLSDAATQTLGNDAGVVVKGDALLDPAAALRVVLGITSSKSVAQMSNPIVSDISKTILNALSANRASRAPINAGSVTMASSAEGAVMSADMNGVKDIPALNPTKEYNSDDGLNNVADGLSDLNADEQEALKATATIVFEKLRERIVARLQPLVK
jgi:aarF domain-containing kinase